MALAGTAERIPLADGAVDARVRRRGLPLVRPVPAVAEIARVLRPGGGVAVLYNRLDWHDAGTPWRAEANQVFHRHRLPADEIDPYDQAPWRAALAAIGELRDDEVERHVQRLDAEGIVAMYASFSGLAGLPPERRDAALAEIRAVLERHAVGADRAELPHRDHDGPRLTRSRRLSWSSRHAGQPSRWAAMPGDRPVGVASLQLGVDVLVEPLEALLAADLGPGGAEQLGDELALWIVCAHDAAPRSWSASAARSLRRASCRVL